MVVIKGARWRIGTGEKISLFSALWLKDELFLTVVNPIYAPLAHVKVKDNIDQSSKVWNTPLIYNMFDPSMT